MAFEVEGLDALLIDLEELEDIPDEVLHSMLNAGGDVVVKAQKAEIQKLGLVDSGKLQDSITMSPKMRKKDSQYTVAVYPSGTHHTYKSKKGDAKDTGAADVGFVQEVGAPGRGIKGKQWMRLANEGCMDEAVAAEMEAYDKYLKSKNL